MRETNMPEVIQGHIYDYPKYYDLIFGSDWKAELDFLEDCFERYTDRVVEKLFEPACGTGRLLFKFAQAGYQVSGNDLNPKAIDYCNDRLTKAGFDPTAVVGDMSDFKVKQKFDAAFNTINSFRHLQTEKESVNHLKCISDGLAKGGLYVLGLHLCPSKADGYHAQESWSARRGNLQVNTNLYTMEYNPKKRFEKFAFTYDIYTPSKQFRIEDEMLFRSYTVKQMQNLFAAVPSLEVVETFDFCYKIDEPIVVDSKSEDVVYVLRKK